MRSSNPARPFTVVVADNFHYMDEGENYEHGQFETLEAAIAASKRIVDEFLVSAMQPGMTADALYRHYTSFGDEPYIIGSNEPGVPFSARTYAEARCQELCGSQPGSKDDGHDV